MSEEKFLTPKEVRTSLRVSRKKVAQMISTGVLESVRLGERTTRIKEASFRRLVAGEAKPLERAQQNLSAINKDANVVRRDPTLTPEQKRQRMPAG